VHIFQGHLKCRGNIKDQTVETGSTEGANKGDCMQCVGTAVIKHVVIKPVGKKDLNVETESKLYLWFRTLLSTTTLLEVYLTCILHNK